MNYRASVFSPKRGSATHAEIYLVLAEAPENELHKRLMVEGAMMAFTDTGKMETLLAASLHREGNASGVPEEDLRNAIEAACSDCGNMYFAGFFSLTPDDLEQLGFKTMAQMAKYLNAMVPIPSGTTR